MQDEEIPALCHSNSVATLITMNVKDFGARKHYYAALLDAGIHVIVARPAKQQPDAGQQLALVSSHLEWLRNELALAAGPVLLKVTHSAAVKRDLAQLIAEVTGLP